MLKPDDTEEVINQKRINQLLEIRDENNSSLLSEIIDLFLNGPPQILKKTFHAFAQQAAKLLESIAHYSQSGIDFLGANRCREPRMKFERISKGRSSKTLNR
jgi:hypothetical protein